MGTKNKPTPCDCYAKAEPDEPLFVLLARDKHAPTLVWLWSSLRELNGEKPEVVEEARNCANAMIVWAREHGRQSVGLAQATLVGMMEMVRVVNYLRGEVRAARREPIGGDNLPTDVELMRSVLAGAAALVDDVKAEAAINEQRAELLRLADEARHAADTGCPIDWSAWDAARSKYPPEA